MSRGRWPWLVSALAMCLPGVEPASAQERVETGLRLRMTDRLDAGAAATGGEPPRADVTTPRRPGEGSGAALVSGVSLRLTAGVRFDDNVLRTDGGERRDAVIVLRPRIDAHGRLGRHGLSVGYEGETERYQRLGSENVRDHRLLSSADLDLSRILKARLHAELEYGTDARGELTTRPLAGGSERDRWRRHGVGGEVTLGRRIATAQVGFRYDVEGVRYLNNGQRQRDFDRRAVVLSGRYNLGSRVSLLAEAGGSWSDYLAPGSPLDSREVTALAGVAWEATAKTRGEVKFGLRHRDYHDPARSSLDGYTWDARVNWTPKSYSQVTAYTTREVTEGGFSGDAGTGTAVVDVFGLRWRYGLTERLTLDTAVQRSTAAFEGGGTDAFMRYDAGLRYRVSRWLDFVGEWTLDTRSSRDGGFEASGVFVGVDLRLDRPFAR